MSQTNDVEEIEQEIAETRRELGDTVEALRDHLEEGSRSLAKILAIVAAVIVGLVVVRRVLR